MSEYRTCKEGHVLRDNICMYESSECPQCNKMVLNMCMNDHESMVHAVRHCIKCHEAMTISFYEEHKENWCHLFREICLYCKAELPTYYLSEHRQTCDMREEFHRRRNILDYLEAQSARNDSGNANPGASANNPSVEVIDQGDIEDDDDVIFVGEQKMEIEKQEMEIIDLVSGLEEDVEVDSSLNTE